MTQAMLDTLKNPELKKYTKDFHAGENLFLEGDDSRDMYILVSGRLEVLKDDTILFELKVPGFLFGEMSYLLDCRRTATVKAICDVSVLQVPAADIEHFFAEFPTLAPQITKGLAQRLKETTKVMHGFREFCDRLPGAVIMTDRERNILAWNRAAEKLHGRTWEQMKGQPLADIYSDPQEYQEFITEIKAGQLLQEKVLKVKHADGEEQYVSTSTTILYDAHHNVEGYVLLGRDVTGIKNFEKKYEKIRNWMIPVLAVGAFLLVALFISIPHFSKGVRVLDQRIESFRAGIIQDTRTLSPVLVFISKEDALVSVQQLMQGYFTDKSLALNGIKGLMLLDTDKKVTAAFWPGRDSDAVAALGTSYSGLTFKGEEESPYKRLTLFRTDSDNPRGVRGEEIAYKMPGQAGWLVFQLDMERLDTEFGIDVKMLDKIDFQ